MRDPSGQAAAAELRRFRKLVNGTAAATFLLILVGGVVRVSDSGLGCGHAHSGTHGWPLCGGRVVPSVNVNSIIEFSHRALATVVVILIGLLVFQALRRLRSERWLVRGTIAAAVLVLVQAGLGGLTVEQNLEQALVAAHLLAAMLLFGILVTLSWAARPESREPTAMTELRGLPRGLAVTASVLVLATITAGGYVAGTERLGADEVPTGHLGAHLACGDEFPTCNGAFRVVGDSRMVNIQLAHRGLMYLSVAAILALVVVCLRRGVRSRLFALLVAILLAQVLLGALNVWLGEHPGLIVTHLAMGALLWLTTLVTALQFVRAPGPATAPDRAPEGAAAIA
jgi:heme A synthase